MRYNQSKFNFELKKHKQAVVALGEAVKTKKYTKGTEIPEIINVIRSGKELALVFSNFKCEACGTTEHLQYHHLIMRPTQEFIAFHKYITQRHYWANILILCEKCHNNFHKRTIPEESKTGIISHVLIERIKKKYILKKEEEDDRPQTKQ